MKQILLPFGTSPITRLSLIFLLPNLYFESAEKHLVLTQATDIIYDSFKTNPTEGRQSVSFCAGSPAKLCSFAWRFCRCVWEGTHRLLQFLRNCSRLAANWRKTTAG